MQKECLVLVQCFLILQSNSQWFICKAVRKGLVKAGTGSPGSTTEELLGRTWPSPQTKASLASHDPRTQREGTHHRM
ncbi:unnamed protein product, partial [Gulo gulo]